MKQGILQSEILQLSNHEKVRFNECRQQGKTRSDPEFCPAAPPFYIGELQRNPHHLGMPTWLQDYVRRWADLIGEQGGAAPDYPFATLYRLRRWSGGRIEAIMEGGRKFRLSDAPEALLSQGSGSQL